MGSICGSTTNTSTSSTRTAPPKLVKQKYREITRRAEKAANQKFAAYTDPRVAAINEQQKAGIGKLANADGVWQPFAADSRRFLDSASAKSGKYAGIAQDYTGKSISEAMPYYKTADDYSRRSAATAAEIPSIDPWWNPYLDKVVGSTMANVRESEAAARADLVSRSIIGGNAFGGDRMGVGAAELERGQGLARNKTVADMYHAGYTTAQDYAKNHQQFKSMSEAQTGAQQAGIGNSVSQVYGNAANSTAALGQSEAGVDLAAAGQVAGLGRDSVAANDTSGKAILTGGNMEYAQKQGELDAAYGEFMRKEAHPFQTTQFLANIALGNAGVMGGTSNTVQQTPGPSPLAQWVGLGAAAVGTAAKAASGMPAATGGAIHANEDVEAFAVGGGVDDMPYLGGIDPRARIVGENRPGRGIGIPQGVQWIKVPAEVALPKTSSDDMAAGVAAGVKGLKGLMPKDPTAAESGMGGYADPDQRGGLYALGGGVDEEEEDDLIPRFDFSDVGLPPERDEPLQLADASGDMRRYGDSISKIESGGRYDLLGPTVTRGAYAGDQAVGKYQVMGKNVGPWTKQHLGVEMTPEEFRNNPEAQDKLFNARFGQYAAKHGPEGAARAWFAGEGGMNDPNRSDQLGTTVAAYGEKFNRGLGIAPQALNYGAAEARSENPLADGQSLAPRSQPMVRSVPLRGIAPRYSPDGEEATMVRSEPSRGIAAGDDSSVWRSIKKVVDAGEKNHIWDALISGGLGMMASKNPNALGAIGEGGLKAMDSLSASRKAQLEHRRLLSTDAREAARLAETQRHNRSTESYQNRTLTSNENYRKGVLDQGQWVLDGVNPDGFPVYRDRRTNKLETGTEKYTPSGVGGQKPAVSQLATDFQAAREERRKTDPSLPPLHREDALKMAQRASREDDSKSSAENRAISAARADNQMRGVEYWRERYGLPPLSEPPAKVAPESGQKKPGSSWWPFGGGDSEAPKPPAPGARKAPDGKWYVPDPDRPGKFLQVEQ